MKQPAYIRKIFWAVLIALGVPLFVFFLESAGVFERFELMAYDALAARVRAERSPHEDIAVVLIDEASLKALNPVVGKWPWPRSIYADLLDFLSMGGAEAVVMDILFTENERGCGTVTGGGLSRNDRILARATESYGPVCHSAQIFKDSPDEHNRSLLGRPLPGDFSEKFSIKGLSADPAKTENNVYYLPFPELYRAADCAGIVEFAPDRDNVFRRTPPLRQYGESFYPVLGLAPLFLREREVVYEEDFLGIDDERLPLGPRGEYLINMYGGFEPYSAGGLLAAYQKIMRGELERLPAYPEEFEGKTVFVGASAVGAADLKATSMGHATPGVMLHASIMSNVLMNDYLRLPDKRRTFSFALLLALLTTFAVLYLPRSLYKISAPIIFAMLYLFYVWSEFEANRLHEVVPVAASILLSFIGGYAYLSATEGKEKRRVRKMLGQYVSPYVLSEVMDKYGDYAHAEVGSRDTVTVLFSDIRNFTTISENTEPDRVVEMVNFYFTAMTEAIFQYNGTIDKFIGDAIMAFWGAPIRAENHAELAVRAAIEMRRRLREIGPELEKMGFPGLRNGIGLNTGPAIVGNIGSEKKLDYTVIGDTVNLASRLEGLTKEHGCDILISEFTYREVRDAIACRYIGDAKVKGREHPVGIYEVLE